MSFKKSIKFSSILIIFAMVFAISPLPFVNTKITYAQSTIIEIPSNFTFNTNLTQGSTKSPDIAYLQRFLNYDYRTRLPEANPCIATPPYNYYDARTKEAIIKFQNLYKSEVLTPSGLTSGTGNLGFFTRNKINQLLITPEYAQIIGSSTGLSTNNLASIYSDLANQSNSPATANYYNQLASTIGQINTSSTQPLNQINPNQISSSITNIQSNNSFGSSSNQNQTQNLPEVVSISHQVIPDCQTLITITGKNFDSTNNWLIGTLGYVKVTSATSTINQSGVRNISFTLNQFSDYNTLQNLYSGKTLDIIIKIKNSQTGKISSQPIILKYSFPGTINNQPLTTEQNNYLLELGLNTDYGSNRNPVQNNNSNSSSNSNAALAVAGAAAIAVIAANAGTAAAASTVSTSPADFFNFGGRLIANIYCSCTSNNLLTILDARRVTKQVLFQPGVSRLHQYYNLSVGVNVLGSYIPGGQCEVYNGTSCNPAGSPLGTITKIGTSAGVPIR